MLRTLLLFTLFFINLFAIDGFKILGICPSTSYSHQQPFQALMKALAARGHSVTVITTIPLKNPVKNYRDIDVSFTYRTKDCTKLRHEEPITLLRNNMKEANKLCEEQLSSPAVQQLILWKNETFDAVIIEQLWYQCYYALVKHYNFPVLIGFLSVGNLPYAMDSVGNPDDAMLNPDMAFPFTDRMTIDERFRNLVYTAWTRYYYRFRHLPSAKRIADKFVIDTPVYDIDRNYSLVILGNNHVFGYPKPLLPNVIEVHSLQITGDPGILPEEIQEFLDNASDGAIYFSLGSNLQTHQLPVKTLMALCNALSSLKQKVLWKHDGNVPVQLNNVKFVKWAPQQAILAHPKVIAYVMQGGLQSLQEAVYYSVPVVAIPFFGDQHFNARKILDAEIGLTLNVDTMTNETIVRVLQEVVDNEKYLQNIEKMSAISKDEQVKPIDRAVWHVEHVLKFPNSRHLKYHGKNIPWYEYYMLDIFSCIAILILIIIWIPYLLLSYIFNKCIRMYFFNTKVEVHKEKSK